MAEDGKLERFLDARTVEKRLLEIYLSKDDEFIPEYGEVILPIESFETVLSENLLTVRAVSTNGEESEIHVFLACRQGGNEP